MPTYQRYDKDGTLLEEYETPDPEPVAADTVIASVAAMTDEQKAALRSALGL